MTNEELALRIAVITDCTSAQRIEVINLLDDALRENELSQAAEHSASFLESHATDSRQSWMMHEAKQLRKEYCKVMGIEDKADRSDQHFDPQGNSTLE